MRTLKVDVMGPIHLSVSQYSVIWFKGAKCSILSINTYSCHSSLLLQNDTGLQKMIGSLYLSATGALIAPTS